MAGRLSEVALSVSAGLWPNPPEKELTISSENPIFPR